MGRGGGPNVTPLPTLLDTDVVIRHLTGDPPEQGRRATRFLAQADDLWLTDLVVAECVFVLESLYRVPRPRIAELIRAAIAMPSITVLDENLLLRALSLYAATPLHFVDAYLAAVAELTAAGRVASFDRDFDALPGVERVVP